MISVPAPFDCGKLLRAGAADDSRWAAVSFHNSRLEDVVRYGRPNLSRTWIFQRKSL